MNAPQGKEADHGCRISSRGGGRSSAGMAAFRLPAERGSYPPGVRFGKMVWQGWVYTPAVTLWVFLSQCLSADHCCVDVVAQLSAWRLSCGQKPCSADTGADCTAREKIPEEACLTLVRETGRHVEDKSSDEWCFAPAANSAGTISSCVGKNLSAPSG